MSYRTFLVLLIIVAVVGAVVVLKAYQNLNKEADECRIIAEQVFTACEQYRKAFGEPPFDFRAVLPGGRTIFESVRANSQEKIRKILCLTEDGQKILWHGSEIGWDDVSAMGMRGYDVYIDWHLSDVVVAYHYHPWENE